MNWKHWWYSLDSNQPNGFITLDDGTVYPAVGQQEIFGQQFWNCTDAIGVNGQNAALQFVGCGTVGNGNNNPAATPPQPAPRDGPWEFQRVRRYHKLGDANNVTWFYYITQKSDNSQPVYRVTFTPVAPSAGFLQVLGSAQMQVKVTVDKCTNTNCTSVVNKGA